MAGEPNRVRTLFAYAAMIAATIGLYLFVRGRGELLFAPEPTTAAAVHSPVHGSTLATVLLALAAIITTARALGWVFKRYLSSRR